MANGAGVLMIDVNLRIHDKSWNAGMRGTRSSAKGGLPTHWHPVGRLAQGHRRSLDTGLLQMSWPAVGDKLLFDGTM